MTARRVALSALGLAGLALAGLAAAAPQLPALTVTPTAAGGQEWSVSLQILAVMTALTLLPSMLLMMTAFTRILVVLALLRQALGTMQTPSNQVLIGLALFLTFFIMAPVFERMNDEALQPYMAEQITFQQAVEKARVPLQAFMLAQTREPDLALFAKLSGRDTLESPETVPFSLLVPAFVTSELKTAFQIGFMLFIPFLVIDLVVASVLMAMGMMMLSPLVISFPFKLMLFVLVDGWPLVMGTLAASFQGPAGAG
ncbi:flagellar type III secretion system pore protein FliP [Plasticicumulans acidivorans]|uniref:Flagellar biosynthetic protein FliP n=1 Tax=Plasticicumulans acidivorans TaxID=886464 RepID=A0A317MY52_9GAMM|nr:flagellar type III secretion system pore protein FliP [Plasticicumulans acidivorans]PWV63272.1 flagellar biosynthetic protein FliP [Plasticicumulans acidivorans]